MFKDKKVAKNIISTVLILLVALGVTLGYRVFVNSQVEKGMKDITVNVVVTGNEDYPKTYKIRTDAEFLGDALVENMELVTQGEKGNRYITGVDNINADFNKEEWWKILINGEMGNYGMDQQPIKDNDVITIQFMVGIDY